MGIGKGNGRGKDGKDRKGRRFFALFIFCFGLFFLASAWCAGFLAWAWFLVAFGTPGLDGMGKGFGKVCTIILHHCAFGRYICVGW